MNGGTKSTERLFCLDLLRGLDMFYLACVSAVLVPLLKALGAGPAWSHFFVTHDWYGFTLYDLIMPLFIFMCGAAVPFALGRRLDGQGRPGPGYWRHVLSRFVLLWVLGMLVQGNLATLDIHKIGLYSNTLQTIAIGYVAAAAVYPLKSRTVKIAIPVALCVAYALIVHFGGDYTKDGNVSQRFDLAVWSAVLPADNAAVARIRSGGYSWLLPSLMFPVFTLAGCFSTEILRSGLASWRKAGWLGVFGATSLAAGWGLYFLGIEMVKHIFTVSFTLQAIGWSVLALDALYVLTDIWKFRKGMGLILLFGQTALAAYLCESLFRGACFAVSERLFSGVKAHLPAAWGDVAIAVGYALTVVAVLFVWRGFRRSRGR